MGGRARGRPRPALLAHPHSGSVVTPDNSAGGEARFGSPADDRSTLAALAGQIPANGFEPGGNGDGLDFFRFRNRFGGSLP
jgi:hypothetical protein